MKNILTKFSPWQRWVNRIDGTNDLSLPGVYLLAEFKCSPARGKPSLSPKIFYIGETCSTLRRRLYDFERSAAYNKSGHSGGITYYNSNNSEPDLENVYISVMPVNKLDIESKAYIRYAERALLWQYFEKHRVMPFCNRK